MDGSLHKISFLECQMKKSVLFFSVKDYCIYFGTQEIKVTKHFFMFLLRLAISYRQTDDWYSQGWCSIDQFLGLPGWENTLLRDAGKNTLRGLEPIEKQVKTVTKDDSERLVVKQHKAYVFKLNEAIIENVRFDIAPSRIIEKFFSSHISYSNEHSNEYSNNYSGANADVSQIKSARNSMYVTGMISTSEVLFETGQRQLAEQNLNDLLKTKSIELSYLDKLKIYTTLTFFAYTSYNKEATKKYIRQTEKQLEYTKDFFEDASKYHARYWIFRGRYHLRFHNNIKLGKDYLDEASLYLNDNHDHYQEWGFYHVTRALIADRKLDFAEAHRQLWASLSAWMKAKWWYGVQAAYYNLGELCLDAYKGHYPSTEKLSKQAKDQLLTDAEEWVTWCERFSRNSGTGEDMVWGSLKLASICRYQNKVSKALGHLAQAKEILDRTQDSAEFAEYYLQLSKVNIVQKDYKNAKIHTKKALSYSDSKIEKSELKKQLAQLSEV